MKKVWGLIMVLCVFVYIFTHGLLANTSIPNLFPKGQGFLLVSFFLILAVIIKYVSKQREEIFVNFKDSIFMDSESTKRSAKIFLRKFGRNKLVWFAVPILVILIGMAFFPSFFATYSPQPVYGPYDMPSDRSPSREHFFGLTFNGLDLWSLLVFQAKDVLLIPVKATFYSFVLGLVLGALAGYLGGFADFLVCWMVNSFLAFVPLVLFMTVLAFVGFGRMDVRIWLYSIYGGCLLSKVVRAQFLSLREREFVQAAESLGCSEFEVIFKHMVINCWSLLLVQSTLFMGQILTMDAALAFLGFGGVGWAEILGQYSSWGFNDPWMMFFPGLLLFLVIVSINILGEGIRTGLGVDDYA
ncbi:ABC transporter permease [Proteinivorax tanatarense]|uniref:ABC transporter permease n=1 Tax=Proteinivorax tanatarense TaxID=1260629 RepID=A0AAU7VLK1_9FIRM